MEFNVLLAWLDMEFPMEYGDVKYVLITVWPATPTLQAWEVHVELVFQRQAAEQMDWFAVNVLQIILSAQ